MARAGKLQIGELIEIVTPNGLAYAQYLLRHRAKPAWGDLIRVLSGLFERRPDHLVELAYQPHVHISFFPASRAVKDGLVRVVGYAEPTPEQSTLPTFRQLQLLGDDGRPHWSLWNGEQHELVGLLTPAQRQLPRGPSLANLAALIEDILFHNGIMTPEKRDWLVQRRRVLEPMAAAFARSGDHRSAANLYMELLDTHRDDARLKSALTGAWRALQLP